MKKPKTRVDEVDYIVIGAGISGLAAATYLKDHGQQVLVLESGQIPGGRMSSIELDRVPADLGAQFIAKSYKNIIAKNKELGLPALALSIHKIGIQQPNNSINYFNPAMPLSLLSFKGLSFGKRLRMILTLPYIIMKPPYINIYNPQQVGDLDNQIAADYFGNIIGNSAVTEVLDPVIHGLAFYSLQNTSAAFLKAMTAKLLTMRPLSYARGIGELSQKLASQLQVKYGAKVIAIERGDDRVLVNAIITGQSKTYRAKKVIVAVPGNTVLNILKQPTNIERQFFEKVEYSSAVIIHCRADIPLPNDSSVLFYKPQEEKQLASIHMNPYAQKEKKSYMVVTLGSVFAKKYLNGQVSDKEILRIIQNKIGPVPNLEILHKTPWASAVPLYYPGYIKLVNEFQATYDRDDMILYCGDYLAGGYTEMAFTSGLDAAKRAINT